MTYETNDDWFFYDHTSTDCTGSTDTSCSEGVAYGLYYFWKGEMGNGVPDNNKVTQLNHLLSKGTNYAITEAKNTGDYNSTWHGGLAVGALIQAYTSSF